MSEVEMMKSEFVAALEQRDRVMLDRGRAEAAAEIERLRAVEKDHESMLSYMREILPEAEPDDDIHKIGERLSAQIGKHEAGAKSLTRIQDKARDLARELGFYRVQRSDESGLEYEAALMAEGKVLVERLRASEAQAIDDADALCEWLRYYDYPSCRFTTVVGAAIKPACMRALDRRAKKEASDDTVKPAQNDTCDT